MNLTNQQLAAALLCPLEKVTANWPLIDGALRAMAEIDKKDYSDLARVGALATVAVETAHRFEPIHEFGSDRLHEQEYGGRADLGNLHPGDGAKYAGNGFVQRTGERNYEVISRLLGIDALAHPEILLQPETAAADFAIYFVRERPCVETCNNQDWARVRKLVNGGLNNYNSDKGDFLPTVFRLLNLLHPTTVMLNDEGGTL